MLVHTAEVVEKRALTSVVRHVVLRLTTPDQFSYQPGQFVQFILGERTFRQFSVASTPARLPTIDLCVDISPMGHGSKFVEGLQTRDPVTFRGPFGVFIVPGTEARPLEFIAAGAGIAPIRAMIGGMFEQGNRAGRLVTLTFGNRTASDILYHGEWRALAEREPTFRYRPTLTQPPSDWAGERGRVTDILRSRSDVQGRVFFLCGSPEMVDDTRKTLADLGVPESDVHFEKFT